MRFVRDDGVQVSNVFVCDFSGQGDTEVVSPSGPSTSRRSRGIIGPITGKLRLARSHFRSIKRASFS